MGRSTAARTASSLPASTNRSRAGDGGVKQLAGEDAGVGVGRQEGGGVEPELWLLRMVMAWTVSPAAQAEGTDRDGGAAAVKRRW